MRTRWPRSSSPRSSTADPTGTTFSPELRRTTSTAPRGPSTRSSPTIGRAPDGPRHRSRGSRRGPSADDADRRDSQDWGTRPGFDPTAIWDAWAPESRLSDDQRRPLHVEENPVGITDFIRVYSLGGRSNPAAGSRWRRNRPLRRRASTCADHSGCQLDPVALRVVTQPNRPTPGISWTLSATSAPAAGAGRAWRPGRRPEVQHRLLGERAEVVGVRVEHGNDGRPCCCSQTPFSSSPSPRRSRYQAVSVAGSFARRKYPPIPSTRSISSGCQFCWSANTRCRRPANRHTHTPQSDPHSGPGG